MLLLIITKTVQRKCRKKLEEFTLSSMIEGQKIFGIDRWLCSSRTILLEGERKNKGSPV